MAAKQFNMATAKGKSRKRKVKALEVPFAHGFHLPTAKQSLNAIGLSPLQIYFEPGPEQKYFHPIPPPSSIDDWLAQYKEESQSYRSFLRSCPWISGRKIKYTRQKFVSEGNNIKERYPDGKIYLQLLGDFETDSSPSVRDLVDYVGRFYTLPVFVLPGVKLILPEKEGELAFWSWDESSDKEFESTKSTRRKSQRTQCRMQKLNFRSHNGRIQLKVDSVFHSLQQQMPSDALCLISLTMTDLYEDEPDLFVAGMASGNQRVAMLSFARYDPSLAFSTEYWYDIINNQDLDLQRKKIVMLQRSCTLLVHEIAHLFGVAHCVWYSCCMNGSGHLDEDFAQPMYLCPVDLHKVQSLCGFDVVERYKKLLEFSKKHGMTDEVQWFEKRLHFTGH